MDFIIAAIAFILIFSVLVVIHEWGHFAAARRAGIKVEEFGFGLPPRIWGKKRGETLYSINAIPFGGFVRLLGEDSRNPRLLKNERSFISKRPRTRLFVLTAGVIMNYLLAVALLTIGFAVGMQPLIIDGNDVFANIENGTIELEQGIRVETVEQDGVADHAGLQVGDQIAKVDGHAVSSGETLLSLIDKPGTDNVYLDVYRDGQFKSVQLVPREGETLGFQPFQMVFLPRVAISDVKGDSVSARAGFKAGDVIVSINGESVYYVEDYERLQRSSSELSYTVLRGGEEETINVVLPNSDLVVISSVIENTPAQEADIQPGDVIVSFNGQRISSAQQVIALAQESDQKTNVYEVMRSGTVLEKSIVPGENRLIGVGLSTINSYENQHLSVYATDLPTSVTNIKDVRYPLWEAPIKAIEESGRLAALTLDMFGNVVRSLVTQFVVPEGVAGPVGIAQLTYVFVQEGLLSVLRFVALLSLSLAILNILPFPALDGGRVFFVLAELAIGRRVGQKFEAIVHAIGFAILMLIIVAVTWSDILRLF